MAVVRTRRDFADAVCRAVEDHVITLQPSERERVMKAYTGEPWLDYDEKGFSLMAIGWEIGYFDKPLELVASISTYDENAIKARWR
jgi:hypothetical protein